MYYLRFLPKRKFPFKVLPRKDFVLFKFCMNSTNCTDFKPKITRYKIFKISYCKWISYNRANLVQSIEEMKPLGFKVNSIGFQNQTHWISKVNPLGFKSNRSSLRLDSRRQVSSFIRKMTYALLFRLTALSLLHTIKWNSIKYKMV